MLENIKSPKDIKSLSVKELEQLASEIRTKIIGTVSVTGGHLGSNLGLVETTLILHKLFDVPKDKLLFDVGHQCYTHKLLTGRFERFDTLRQSGGISGFTNRFESEYDILTAGHSGSSISAALGIATAEKLAGGDGYTVCIVGDGSFTNGMIYEALNNCNNKQIRLIIVLNDNEMSISQNVGSLAKYLSKIRTSGRYYRFKRNLQRVLRKVPVLGENSIVFARHIKNGLKRVFYKQPFFEALGVRYLGPVDGTDLERMQVVFEEAKKDNCCTLVHIKTKKGCGYKYAEESPENYHSVGAFDPDAGVGEGSGNSFSAAFGRILCDIAARDTRLCAITSAMRDGTGLTEFSHTYPTRFFDVGIAEEHEVAFAGGLAVSGLVPVCALYSTFAQRTYDQLIHDVALQKLHIVLALDRAGFVPGDGETHQGIFDCAFLSEIPGTRIYSPDNFDELRMALENAVAGEGIAAVRYPRGGMTDYDRTGFVLQGDFSVCDTFADGTPRLAVITYGQLTADIVTMAKALHENGINVRIVRLFKVWPVNDYLPALRKATADIPYLYFAEEGMRDGGIAQKLAAEFALAGEKVNMRIRAIPDVFPPHGSLDSLKRFCGLDSDAMRKDVLSFLTDVPSADS
ncbi:MAG: 1-deoxy-D-xylulose-5-phosphate synthase [Eubacteriales bacterium]